MIGTSVGTLVTGLIVGHLRTRHPLFGRIPDGAVALMTSLDPPNLNLPVLPFLEIVAMYTPLPQFGHGTPRTQIDSAAAVVR